MTAARWHNALPAWIQTDLAERLLRQGPRATLQAIADCCDAPEKTCHESLLVCFGGKGLIRACGCATSTFWTHLRTLKERGYVVELQRGGGRLASIYGVAGSRGELDPYRAKPGQKPRRWREADTARIRSLVSENRTLADRRATTHRIASRSAGARGSEGSRSKTGGQPSGNRTLPSHCHSSEPSYLPSHNESLLTRLNELGFGNRLERVRLVKNSSEVVSSALARLDKAMCEGARKGKPIRNPAGLLRTFLDHELGRGAGGLAQAVVKSVTAPSVGKRTKSKAQMIEQVEQWKAAGPNA